MTLKRSGRLKCSKKLKSRKAMPKMSAKQRKKLAARGIAHPATTFAPPKLTAARSTRPVSTGFDAATVDLALERAGWACERGGEGISGRRGVDWSAHHRKLRSQGGDNSPSNCLILCGHGTSGCHGAVHASPDDARKHGWLLWSTDNPETYPADLFLHGRSRLSNDGRRTPAPKQEACA